MGRAGIPRLTAAQASVVMAALLGWVLDYFDFALMVFVLRDIAREFSVPLPAAAFVIVLTLAMRPVGAFIFGRAADCYGRRPALMASILCFSLLAFASGFATSMTMLLVLRALFGIAMGGEWGVGASLAMETVPPGARGMVSGILQTGGSLGYLLASLVFGLLYQQIGWRGMLMIGVAPALLVLFIRARTREAPQWQPDHKPSEDMLPGLLGYGRLMLYALLLWAAIVWLNGQTLWAGAFILAVLAMTVFLAWHRVGLWIEVVAVLSMAAVDGCASAGLVSALMALIYNTAAILTATFLKTHLRVGIYAVLLMTALNFFAHGTQDLYPTFLQVQRGLSPRMVGLIMVLFSIGGILGSLVFGGLSERLGRRRTMAVAALLALFITTFFTFGATPLALAVTAFMMNLAVMGSWGVVPCYLNELSPPRVRGTFTGLVYQLGNLLASVNATMQADYAVRHGNNYAQALVMVTAASALAILALVGLFGIDRKGIVLEIAPVRQGAEI
jgi:MFS family permease